MGLLTREQIFEVQDLQQETVSVPEWAGDVIVRGLTGAERDRWEDGMIQGRGKKRRIVMLNARASLAALTVVDETGKRLFSNADAVALGKKSAAALDRIFSAAMRLSGLTEEDIEDLTGNFDGVQSEDSTFASPSLLDGLQSPGD